MPLQLPLAGDQGCYAEAAFHARLHLDRLSRGESGFPAAAFLRQVMALPPGILFRHCVAGDQWPDPADPPWVRKEVHSVCAIHKGATQTAGMTCRTNAAAVERDSVEALTTSPLAAASRRVA
jgi:hypothetical protein